MLNAVILNVVMLNVIMLNVIMLNVVAPIPPHCNCQDCFAKNFADVKTFYERVEEKKMPM